ncbi:hypothetical protein Aca07nite_19730 [Actinoplanes capillaceus]|uniref:Uncharacterized protein n=1 Tax=Actinoplanes campanulatus TaxID=113559 RepID=A0ABQ3WFZ8_9ACTN|nr:hypothetical protein [Actinoplanes capillaceus]GID44698.1 hypothetical protein Aca07nite_19730 [Actinoplanes capillaceus]
MTTTTSEVTIPASEHLTGFTAVTVRFPTDPAAHRAVTIHHRADGTTGGLPVQLTEQHTGWTEVRPACRPDSDPDGRFYRLSVPAALHRGAVACDQPECYRSGDPR